MLIDGPNNGSYIRVSIKVRNMNQYAVPAVKKQLSTKVRRIFQSTNYKWFCLRVGVMTMRHTSISKIISDIFTNEFCLHTTKELSSIPRYSCQKPTTKRSWQDDFNHPCTWEKRIDDYLGKRDCTIETNITIPWCNWHPRDCGCILVRVHYACKDLKRNLCCQIIQEWVYFLLRATRASGLHRIHVCWRTMNALLLQYEVYLTFHT